MGSVSVLKHVVPSLFALALAVVTVHAEVAREILRDSTLNDAHRMAKDLLKKGFHEWWSLDNQPRGSGEFRGSAGVLGRAIELLQAWAEQHQPPLPESEFHACYSGVDSGEPSDIAGHKSLWRKGVSGACLQFDDYNTVVSLPTAKTPAIGGALTLEFTLAGSPQSPVLNPAFVVKNWGGANVMLTRDGKVIPRGKDFRYGHRQTLEGTDLSVWIKTETQAQLTLRLEPQRNP